ncbi:unnamed protein product [Prunus brigantina]
MESQMCGGVEEEKKYVACRFQRKQTENWIEKYHGCEVELTTRGRDGSKRRRSRSLSHSLSVSHGWKFRYDRIESDLRARRERRLGSR